MESYGEMLKDVMGMGSKEEQLGKENIPLKGQISLRLKTPDGRFISLTAEQALIVPYDFEHKLLIHDLAEAKVVAYHVSKKEGSGYQHWSQ